MSTSEPLRIARLGALFFSYVFGVIGFSVGLNASVKSNQDLTTIRNGVAEIPGASVNIDSNDVSASGGVIIAVCALLALLSIVFFTFTCRPIKNRRFSSWFSLRFQSCSLLFGSIWLFATLIPFDYFVANRQVQVSASLDGLSIPASLIQDIEAALGFSPMYKDMDYLVLLAVLPWFALLFSVIAGVVLHFAARRAGAIESEHAAAKVSDPEKPKTPEPEA